MSISVGMSMAFIPSKVLTQEEFDEIIKLHALWKADHNNGKRADLSGYDLSNLNFHAADLSKADLRGSACIKTSMAGVNLTGARMQKVNFMEVDLTDAVLEGANLMGGTISCSNLTRLKASNAVFMSCTLWENDFSEAEIQDANFVGAQLGDSRFISADLCFSDFYHSDIDNTDFSKADLSDVNFTLASNSQYAIFKEADMADVNLTDSWLSDDAVEGAKNLVIHMACPEEGSFIAWTKSIDNKIVKLLIPETAERTGRDWYSCRASEVKILAIFEGDKECDEIAGFWNCNKKLFKGETARSENYDGSLLHGGGGILFVMSRREAENIADYE